MIKHEPHKIKSIRNIPFYYQPERQKFLMDAFFNVNLLPASTVTFDMVVQGSSAFSQEQMAALFIGDEAYAGARNFENLAGVIKTVFGKDQVCPMHNRTGALKLLSSIYIKDRKIVAGNTDIPAGVVSYFKGEYFPLPGTGTGDLDMSKINEFIGANAENVAFIYIDVSGGGFQPVSFSNLQSLKKSLGKNHILVVLDASSIAQTALYYKTNDTSFSDSSISEIILKIAEQCDTILFDAGQDGMSNVGGFLATNDAGLNEKHQNEVVVFEGLHTYGGMAGRTMEVVASGVKEMTNDLLADWLAHQVNLFAEKLQNAGVPFIKGLHGVYLKADEILKGIDSNKAQTLAAAIYLTSGVRALKEGSYGEDDLLPVLIPHRALMNSQIKQIAEAIINVYNQRESIPALINVNSPAYQYEVQYEWLVPCLNEFEFTCEPYTVHAIEQVGMKSREQRAKAMEKAGYNTFLLKSADVTIDFLTDSGTSAMSVEQWNKYLAAQETPGTPDAYIDLVTASQETYGYEYIIPTHQGRAAEHIMSQMFISEGDYVPGNMYFTTTKLHQEIAGGIFADVIIDEAHQTTSEFPWKGNIDMKKLSALYEKAKSEGKKLAYVSFEFNVNMAGGQPVSMDNIKEVYSYCRPRNIPVFFDATRCAENACFIQQRDPRYSNIPVADILLEMFSYGDGATISCKKDMLSNLSGCLMFRDNEEWFEKGLQMLQLFEGPFCSGGTSAGDMAAHAQGLREMVDDLYIQSRVKQAAYLGSKLKEAGIPLMLPPGGHAIFLDARAFLSHLDQDEYPAQMLASQIFIETGVRPMERGNVSKGRNPKTGKNYRPALELVRLTIPRRVYTLNHLDAVAEGIIRLYEKRDTIKGLEFTYEPEKLRFFQGRFKVK